MRKVKLFIAMSLDGYIADADGSVHWLEGQGDSHEDIDVYSEFVKDIIPILLGSGVRLFEKGEREIKLRLLWTQSYNGMTDLVYERR